MEIINNILKIKQSQSLNLLNRLSGYKNQIYLILCMSLIYRVILAVSLYTKFYLCIAIQSRIFSLSTFNTGKVVLFFKS